MFQTMKKIKKSDMPIKRVLDTTKSVRKEHTVEASTDESAIVDNAKIYQCVLCEEKFAEHSLMIEHFR